MMADRNASHASSGMEKNSSREDRLEHGDAGIKAPGSVRAAQAQLPADTGVEADTEDGQTRTRSVLLVILVSLLAAAMLTGVILSFNKRNSIYNEVAEKTTALNLAEAENVRLQSELEGKMSAKNVEDYAENVLGMRKIDSSQIKYIKIQTEDVVDIPEHDDGFIAKVKDFFDKCVEYFRR